MGWRDLIPAALLILGVAGCQRSASETQLQFTLSDPDEATDVVAMPVADQPATAIRPEEPDEFAPPFPENANFFSPPTDAGAVAVAVPQIAADDSKAADQPAATGQLDLRVIGFVQVEGERPKAMLHVNGQLEIVAAGDTLGDLEILDVSEPLVSLQHADQEVTVGLSDRSAGNHRVAQRQLSDAAAVTRRAWSRRTRSGSRNDSAQLPGPVDFAALPAVPAAPSVELPQIELPEILQVPVDTR